MRKLRILLTLNAYISITPLQAPLENKGPEVSKYLTLIVNEAACKKKLCTSLILLFKFYTHRKPILLAVQPYSVYHFGFAGLPLGRLLGSVSESIDPRK